jgi:DNA-binding FadR family transcriptional regulator
MPSFKPVKQARISVEVLGQLKKAILRGEYQPGVKLPSERELCDQFQVSRVVVREAIRALEMTGFVRLKQGPSGGAFVQELTLDHLSSAFMDLFLASKLSASELVKVRKHLEPEVARLAAANHDPKLKRRLEKAFKDEHTGTLTHAQWVSRNLAIHYLLARMCNNRFYEAMMTPLLDLTLEMVLVVKPSHKVIHDHGEHKAIVDAVISQDPQAAGQAMTEHIEKVGASLIELEEAYRQKKGLNT